MTIALIKGMIEHRDDSQRKIEERAEQKGFAVSAAEA